MTTPSKNLQQVVGALIEREEKNDTLRNDSNVTDEEFDINMDQLHKKFCNSLDINHPTQPELIDQSCFSIENQVNSKIEITAKDTKKRSISETAKSEYETCLGLDLELKLSPPESSVSDQNTSNPLKSSFSLISLSASSLSSQWTYISYNIDSDHENNLCGTSKDELPSLIMMGCTHCHLFENNLCGTSKDELPSLIVMGCSHCHLFVMVSKSGPKCPKCSNPNLLDVDADNLTKKSKSTLN